ncbi:MAG: PKD domain-containing protein [Phycisphaerae bacterium]
MRSHLARLAVVAAALSAAAAAALAQGGPPPDLDGLVITIRQVNATAPDAKPADKKARELVRHELKAGKPIGSKVLTKCDDRIISACLSPFGYEVAYIKPGGTLAVIDTDGANERELADDALWVQWPAGDGGAWVYYLDAKSKSALRRVNLKSKQDQLVVEFDHAIPWFTLSQDATPSFGRCLVSGGDSGMYACVYPMARGTGDLFAVPQWYVLGKDPLAISCDGTTFANTGRDGSLLLIGIPPQDFAPSGYRLDPFMLKRAINVAAELGAGQTLFDQPAWSVDSVGWVVLARNNYAEPPEPDKKLSPVSSDIVLFDVVRAAHHGIRSSVDVTANVAGTFERPVGFWEKQPAQYSLGYYRGKAPLTIEIDDARIHGEFTWDFGDGSPRVTGRTVKHTYAKDGRYKIIAEKAPWAKPLQEHLTKPDQGLYTADITVLPRQAPTAAIGYVDATHLLVQFNEPVQAKDAQVTLGKTKVNSWKLRAGGREMTVELAEPIKGDETLTLKGVTDLAAIPNALRDANLKVSIPDWPSNRDGLFWMWGDTGSFNAFFDPNNKSIRPCDIFRDGPKGGFDNLGRMELGPARGAMRTSVRIDARAGYGDAGEATLKSTFSFECVFQSGDLVQQALEIPPSMVCYGAHRSHVWCFAIRQQAEKLLVSIKTEDDWLNDHNKPEIGNHGKSGAEKGGRKGTAYGFYGHAPMIEFATLKDTNPHHLIVSYKPGVLVCYMDGQKVYQTDRVTGELGWPWGWFVLGGHHWLGGSGNRWNGTMEGVAMYGRFIDADEAAANFRAYLKKAQARAGTKETK